MTISSARAIDPPTLQCIHMNHNDTMCQVSWNHPNNYSGINTIEVWVSSDLGGPYSLAQTINAGDTVCSTLFSIDPLLGDNADEMYCYLKARPDAAHISEGSVISDTMHSMVMTVIPRGENPAQNSRALLHWTAPEPFPSTSSNQEFSLYKKREGELGYTRIATLNSSTRFYVDTADICNGEISYYIRIFNYALNPACQFSTRVKTDLFADATPPNTPILDSVSVDFNTQRIELGWTQTSSDAVGCIIYHSENAGGPWPPLDTVLGTHWLSPSHNGNEQHFYRIAAIDQCFETSQTIAGNMTNTYQTNMILNSPSQDVCHKIINLQWSAYQNMTRGLAEYKIYYAQDGGNFQYLASSTTNSYACTGLPANHNYTFIVKAVNQTGNITASSSKCVITNYVEGQTGDFCYIRHASVVNNQAVEIKILTSGDTLPFREVKLYRSVNNDQNFEPIATISYQTNTANYTYIDAGADVNNNVNYYKTAIVNECGADAYTSNTVHTILLSAEGNAAQENSIRWNNYEGFDGGTDNYDIYRKVEISNEFVPIVFGHSATTVNTYRDDVSELFEMGSTFQYSVKAHEGTNRYGFADTSRSNTVEVKQFPNTYIPNAFHPTGTLVDNQVFKPVNSFMNTTNYLFTVYSRQGEIVFTTTDITEGWNGHEQKSGKVSESGMYVYRLQYTDTDGKLVVRHGTVVLVR